MRFCSLKLILGSFLLGVLLVGAESRPVLAQSGPWFSDMPKLGTVFTVGDRTLPDPLFPYESLMTNDKAAAATDACRSAEPWEPVLLSYRARRGLIPDLDNPDSHQSVLAFDSTTACIRVGHPVRLVLGPSGSELFFDVGWFFPTAISGPRPGFASEEERLLLNAGLLAPELRSSSTKPVFVTGHWIRPSAFNPLVSPLAPKLEGARAIGRDQMEAAIRSRQTIVDVRSPQQFKVSHVEGAINIPYSFGALMLRSGLQDRSPYSNYAMNGDLFEVSKLPPDRNKSVVLIAESITDPRVFRAAIVLQHLQYRRIFFFYEGMTYFNGMMWRPPYESSLVKAIDPPEAAKILGDPAIKAKVVDVRGEVEFRFGTLQTGAETALNAPMIERNADIRYRRPELNGRLLWDFGDRWAPPADLPMTTPLVFVAHDGLDWRGYKAALISKALGFSTVYWLRGGISEWQGYGYWQPARYKIARPVMAPAVGTSSEKK